MGFVGLHPGGRPLLCRYSTLRLPVDKVNTSFPRSAVSRNTRCIMAQHDTSFRKWRRRLAFSSSSALRLSPFVGAGDDVPRPRLEYYSHRALIWSSHPQVRKCEPAHSPSSVPVQHKSMLKVGGSSFLPPTGVSCVAASPFKIQAPSGPS